MEVSPVVGVLSPLVLRGRAAWSKLGGVSSRRRRRRRRSRRVRTWGLIAGLLAALVAGVVAVQVKMDSATHQSAGDSHRVELVKTSPPLKLPNPGDKVVFFGDSWTQGFSADPETDGYAYLVGRKLGAVIEVAAAHQSGFVRPAADGSGTYRDRLLARPVEPDVRLVVLQCSVNDLGFSNEVDAAAQATMPIVRDKFPNAEIVVVGPSTAQAQTIDAIRALSTKVLTRAADAGFYVINPAGYGWITAHNIDQVIDPVTLHPSTQGHVYLAGKLLDALEDLAKNGQISPSA